MPNKIEENKRDILFKTITGLVKGIDHSGGYNTQPFVTTDPDIFLSSDLGKHVIYIHAGNEDVLEKNSGPRFLMESEFLIAGYAFGGGGNIQEETNKLLQDCRTALTSNIETISDAIGAMVDFGIGGADVDDGTILGNNTGGFAFPVMVQYWAGAVW